MDAVRISSDFVFDIIKKRPRDSNKSSYGKLVAVCGSRRYTGAAALAVSGALRSGAGIVCLASTAHVILPVSCGIYECTFLPLSENEDGGISLNSEDVLLENLVSAGACLAGCGMGCTEDTFKIIKSMIENISCQLILDADALNSVSRYGSPDILQCARKAPVITPHVGEMSRLTGVSVDEIKLKPAETALEFASKYGCITVLKDYVTYIASPDGRLFVSTAGNPGLARGGSGDILAGMTASFCAQRIDACKAAVCAVHLHGLSADRCASRLSQYGMLPSDILNDLCGIFLEWDR